MQKKNDSSYEYFNFEAVLKRYFKISKIAYLWDHLHDWKSRMSNYLQQITINIQLLMYCQWLLFLAYIRVQVWKIRLHPIPPLQCNATSSISESDKIPKKFFQAARRTLFVFWRTNYLNSFCKVMWKVSNRNFSLWIN